jgi:hypothetical protein
MAAPGWKQPGGGGEEGTVGGSQPRALDLAAQHPELMAQHDQLEVLGLGGAAAANQQLQQGDEGEIDEGEEHLAMLPETTRASAQLRSGFWHPSGVGV